MTLYCECEAPVMDVEHDAGCRRCGRPVDFAPAPPDHLDVRELRDQLNGWRGDLTVRFEDQSGRLLGNLVTDVYRMRNVYAGTPGDELLVVALDKVEVDDDH